ncbi:hypothetical protein KBQ02_26970, partial [Klebsiella pneumoniae]|nr:hypothetical protein [Klebsiella pneumoniae]MCT2862028.1 hypothetical protein [Klebsiella pneumoniae]
MFAGKKSAQIREILISESAWEEMTCLFAPSLNGKIRLGTLNYYRGIENEKQGDVLEGLSKYKVPYQEFDKTAWDEVIKVQPQFAQLVEVAEGGTVIMRDCETESYCHDEYIVCATTVRNDDYFKEDFGEFCIKIEQP